jgi:hypothetical protein
MVGEPMLGVVPMTLAPPEALDDPTPGVVPTELPKTLGGVPVTPGVVVTAPGVVVAAPGVGNAPGTVLGVAPGTVLGTAPGTVLGTAPGTAPGVAAPGAGAPPTCAAAGREASAATIATGMRVR